MPATAATAVIRAVPFATPREGAWDEMSVQRGASPRLLPLLLALLLLCLCLTEHTAEAKKKKKSKQPTRVSLNSEPSHPSPPPASRLKHDTLGVAIDPSGSSQQQQPAVNFSAGAANASSASSRMKKPSHTTHATQHPSAAVHPSLDNPFSHVNQTASSARASPSVLLYPLIALSAVASTLGLAYAYYRFFRAKSVTPAPAVSSLPLLRALPLNHPAGRSQGSEWAVAQLKWDEDGDCAHDFLGPFGRATEPSSSSEQDGVSEKTEESVVQSEQAAIADKGPGKKARKKG